jgi:dienelactone hydrolase
MSIARLALHLALSLVLSGSAAFAATPPAQPKSGPGGAENAGAEVVKRAVGTQSAYSYAYYTAGKPETPRPVVVFLHGWGATNPMVYGGWIDHLARRGYLVLFPAFQEVGRTRPVDATARAAARVKAALAALQSDPDARPDTTRVAILGHSAGAGVAANLAAIAKTNDLPVPKLVFLMMPGGIASDEKSRGIQLADLAQIDAGTDMIAMVGDRESAASERVSRRILRAASEVPPSRKLFMRAGSDDHGFPTLSATLAAPGAPLDGYDTAARPAARPEGAARGRAALVSRHGAERRATGAAEPAQPQRHRHLGLARLLADLRHRGGCGLRVRRVGSAAAYRAGPPRYGPLERWLARAALDRRNPARRGARPGDPSGPGADQDAGDPQETALATAIGSVARAS